MGIFVSNYFNADKLSFDGVHPVVGAEIAKDALYQNLLLRGSFKEYHFFVPAGFHPPKNLPQGKKAFFHPDRYLPHFLKEARKFVFFTPTAGISNVCNLRTLFSQSPFAVCGISADLSRKQHLQEELFPLFFSDTLASDSIIYHSVAAGAALKKLLAFLHQGLRVRQAGSLRYQGRLDHIPLAIEAEQYFVLQKAVAQKKLGFNPKEIHILYVGRFAFFNKADLYPLLVVFKKLLSKHAHIRLVLAGQNLTLLKYCEKLKKIAAEMGIGHQIRFYDNVSEKLKRNLYAASDIFVSPADSLQEAFGLTVLEAMAAGLPVVVSDWDGYRDIVVHNSTGFRVPTVWGKCDTDIAQGTYLFSHDFPGEYLGLSQSVCIDNHKLAQYLEILITRKALRRELGAYGRRRVKENFDWPVVFPRYEKLWRELAAQAASCRKSKQHTPFLFPQYFKAYQGHATQILNKSSRVKVTLEGRHFLRDKSIPAGYPGLRFFQPRLVYLILLLNDGLSGVSTATMYRSMRRTLPNLQQESVTFHILWMLKYNLLELC